MQPLRWFGILLALALVGCAPEPAAVVVQPLEAPAPTVPAPDIAPAPAPAADEPPRLTVPLQVTNRPPEDRQSYADARVGDFVEYRLPTGMMRIEVYAVTPESITLIYDLPITKEGKIVPGRSATKFLFTATTPPHRGREVVTAADRRFAVEGGMMVSDSCTETYDGDNLVMRTWSSRSIPVGGQLYAEAPDGSMLMQLVRFGRGR